MQRAAAATAVAVLAALGLASACGHVASSASHATAMPSPSSRSPLTAQDLQSLVHSYAVKIAVEERRAPCQTSSNPRDYVKYCPTIKRLVALGPPALPIIAREIQTRAGAGLDGYLLAIAGDTIWGPHGTPIAPGAQSWASGDQWAAQYLAASH